jgi:hypothetical protein
MFLRGTSEPVPRRPRISPAALSLFQQCLQDACSSRNFDRLVSLEPGCKIAGAACNRALGLEAGKALFVEIFLAVGLATLEGDDLGDWRVAIVNDDRAARADVIEIALKAVAEFRDFGFFHMTPGL